MAALETGPFRLAEKYRLLSRIVRLAWEKRPGYRDHWKSHGWHPSNLRTLEDADDIPIIAKETIRSNVDQFTVTGGNPLFDFTTSGTTGAPFSFKYTSLLNAAHLSAVAIAASYGDGSKQPWQQKALIVKRSVRGASATGAGGGLLINAAAVKDASLIRQLVEAYKPTLLFGWPPYVGDISAALRGDYEFRIQSWDPRIFLKLKCLKPATSRRSSSAHTACRKGPASQCDATAAEPMRNSIRMACFHCTAAGMASSTSSGRHSGAAEPCSSATTMLT